MKGPGHHLTGLAAGLLVAPEVALPAIASVMGGWVGGVAPDALEIPIGARRLIPHRRITHWILLWIGGVIWAWQAQLPPLASAWFLGFFAGGLAHCLGDIVNPVGIPVLHPWRRWGLGWWKSGQHDLKISIVALGFAGAAQHEGLSVIHSFWV